MAVVTLALCIGANTAVYSVVDAILLRPLPFPEPERLFQVSRFFRAGAVQSDSGGQNGRTWELVRDHASYVEAAVLGSRTGVNLASGGRAQYIQIERVGAGSFRVLDVAPVIGREFTRDEDRPGGPALAILSYGLWKRSFQGDSSVLGRSIILGGEPYTVIGIMPERFQITSAADVWTPLRPSVIGEGSGFNYGVIARLRPGVSLAQADAQIESVGMPAIEDLRLPPHVSARLRLIPLQHGLTQGLRQPLFLLWGSVGAVLLIGCVNIMSVLLARAGARAREIATRLALGCSRPVLLRQLMAESLVLAVLGGAAGVIIALFSLGPLNSLAAGDLDAVRSVTLSGRVLLVTAALSMLASLLFGLLPAWQASSVDIRSAMTVGGGVVAGRKRWFRRWLVSAQVALAVVLLTGAGLLIRTLAHLNGLQPGFDPSGVWSAKFSVQDTRYKTPEHIQRLFDDGLTRIRRLPGVESAAVALSLPYERWLNTGFERIGGSQADQEPQITDLNYITSDYFQVLRIPLLQGRKFLEIDGPSTGKVAIVNEAFVRKYLPGKDVIGQHLRMASQSWEVVGVAGNTQQRPGWGGGFGPLALMPAVYIPAAQTPAASLELFHTWFSPTWVVRASGRQEGLVREIESATASVDPLLPIASFHSMEEIRFRSLSWQRFLATLLGIFSGLALLLVMIGIFGLIANVVVERSRELGIRMALGANVTQAIRAVAMPGILSAAVGLIAGVMLARLVAQVMQHLVWGISPTDPATFAIVAMGLFAVAMLASLLPALRVTHLDPAQTLRSE